MKVIKLFGLLLGVTILSVSADLIENSRLKQQYLSNCFMTKVGKNTVKFCVPQFLKNQLEKEEKNFMDVLKCMNKTPNFYSEILGKQDHFTAQGDEISTVISFSRRFKNPTILFNTTPVEDPLTGGEILLLPFPSDLSSFCQKTHQKQIVSKSKNLLTKLEQAALKSSANVHLRLLSQIQEDQVVAVTCPIDAVQASVPYHHTIESNCNTPDIDELIEKASTHYQNRKLMKILNKASIGMPHLSVTLSMFRPYDLNRNKEFLCKEGIRFSIDGGVYIRGKRISTKHVIGKTKNQAYVTSFAEQNNIDPVILHTALLTQLKINAAKNLVFIGDNPLDIEIKSEEITVPEIPTHMPGMGSVGGEISLDDSNIDSNIQLVTKTVQKIKFLEKYTFNEEGIITGKEENLNPFMSWY